MVASAFAHLFSVLFLHAYRRPRELTWVSGVLLLLLTLAFGFTGYLLPWNEVSFFATRVGTDIAATLPMIGRGLVRFLRGGNDVSGATLTRLFSPRYSWDCTFCSSNGTASACRRRWSAIVGPIRA
jgi:cytochrome b6